MYKNPVPSTNPQPRPRLFPPPNHAVFIPNRLLLRVSACVKQFVLVYLICNPYIPNFPAQPLKIYPLLFNNKSIAWEQFARSGVQSPQTYPGLLSGRS